MTRFIDAGFSSRSRFAAFVVAKKWFVFQLGPVWLEVRFRP